MNQILSTSDHSRDIAGLKYVYPVISRRSGGLSIGINFNTNNACNWRCVYCQVPDLVRGAAVELDLNLLEQELRLFLKQVQYGDFYRQFSVPDHLRVIKDIAISGNGEPSSLKHFAEAIDLIGSVSTELGVLPDSKFVLISNGSLIHHAYVQHGLSKLDHFQGQVWFKLDSATEWGRRKINDTRFSNQRVLQNLTICSEICDTCIQTCVMEFLTAEESEREAEAYLALLTEVRQKALKINKIMLYTLARPSLQPEAAFLKAADEEEMNRLANRIKNQGYQVEVSCK